MLVQVALISMAMFGILALVVDAGYVTLTRVQMQNAADAAAIDGVRNRNAGADGFWSDCRRRAAVHDLVQWTFDDNLDAATSDPSRGVDNFGAGPVIDLGGGDGTDLGAYTTIQPPGDPYVYKPDLKRNQTANTIDGDMVSGHFDPSFGSAERDDYTRDDFAAAAPVLPDAATSQKCGDPPPDTPNPALLGDDNNAFLVRFRRTREAVDTESDASSAGPSLPLMFGLGTAVHKDPDHAFSPRTQGLTVRGTAIARVRPALRVGLRQPGAGYLGAAPFALDWTNFVVGLLSAAGDSVQVDVNTGTGIISSGGADVGRFVDDLTTINSVGQVPPHQLGAALSCDEYKAGGAGFAPVYADFSGVIRILGFLRLEWSWPTCTGNMTVSKPGTGLVANANATAVLAGGFPADMSSADIVAFRNYIADINDTRHVALLAPALAR